MPEEQKRDPVSDKAVIELALKRFQQAAEAEDQWRADSLDDLEFSTGNQWSVNIRSQRENDKNPRPCLTMDQTQQSVRLVCNEFRQNPIGVQVNPIGSGSDVQTGEILEGCIRHIEDISDATIAYEMAHEQVVRTGIGHWRILSDYANDDGDEQEIFIRKIRNQFSVYWQPELEYEDKTWAFITTDIPIERYRDEYKDTSLAQSSLDNFTATGNAAPGWVTKEDIRIAEYFTVETENVTKRRPKKQVVWKLINAIEVIEERNLPGSSIPILTCVGDDLDVNGKRYLAGLIRNAKEPQRLYNYMASGSAEIMALAPKAPWVAVAGQLEGRENEWADPNTYVLQYKQVDIAGKPAPAPARQAVEPPIQAISEILQQASMNVKAAMGIYDPSLGQRKGNESGIAVQHLQIQGSIATLNFSDNVSRTARRSGRLLIEWIKDKYDTPRVQRIIDPDGTSRQVITHNGPDQLQAAQALQAENKAISKIYDIGVGNYDVAISVGPSYQSKRQEAVDTQMNLLKTLPPQAAGAIMDITVRNMDIPQAEEIADRLKKLLPPNLVDGDDADPKVQVQKLQAQLQQMGQQHELLAKVAQEQGEALKTKQIEQQGKMSIEQLKTTADVTIAKAKIDAQVAIAEINTKAQVASERSQMFHEVWLELHGTAHDAAMQSDQQAHQKQLSQQAAQQAQQSQQSDQAHDVGMAAVNAEQPEEVAQ